MLQKGRNALQEALVDKNEQITSIILIHHRLLSEVELDVCGSI